MSAGAPKDLFSTQADQYARYRPTYPAELIEFLLPLVPARHRAWDCATGNGQAALLLAPHFDQVEATDSSQKQLALAPVRDNIHYHCCPAEKTSFPDQCFDLVTVAQAYHWFNFDNFEREVRRVLRPEGILAVWGYHIPVCEYGPVQQLLEDFYRHRVGAYWDAERKWVDDRYRHIPFPYRELPARDFFISQSWAAADLAGYLNSWSSVQHFITDQGINPVAGFLENLLAVWPVADRVLPFRFPVFMRLGQV